MARYRSAATAPIASATTDHGPGRAGERDIAAAEAIYRFRPASSR